MTSAFEFYKNKKKKPKSLQFGDGPKKKQVNASTPLPQSSAQIFTPDEPSASQIFLSPISSEKRRKKKRKLNNSVSSEPIQENGVSDEETVVQASPKRKLKLKSDPEDSILKGKNLLAWILSPVTVDEFFSTYWEKRPLYIERHTPEYFKQICSIDDLFHAFKACPIHLLKNVTVTSYENGKRVTDSTPGRARPNVVRDFFENGHSIRVLNPQTFVPNVGSVVACLQEFFRCMVGVNSYLTPAGTQGFAPHYDDIEAFVLQMEGEKLWKVYPPRYGIGFIWGLN